MRLTQYSLPGKLCTGMERAEARTLYSYTFDSPAEFADYSKSNGRQNGNDESAGEWYGNASMSGAVRLAHAGDESFVPASDKLLEQFETYMPEASGRVWVNDVAGSMPNVPAFVSGSPLSMRRKGRDDTAQAPIAIMVDVTASAMISAKDMARRGTAIIALVRSLAMTRPVELWAGSIIGADSGLNGVAMFARIETAPLDLATACFALAHPAYLRRIAFNLGRKHGFTGGWPFNSDNATRTNFREIMQPTFDHVGDCICIPACLYGEDILENPVAWIKGKLEAHGVVDLADTEAA